MDKVKIKLKECCLTCEHFEPQLIGLGYCCVSVDERSISCTHMVVCGRIHTDGEDVEIDE